ncbi:MULTISPECIES: hypothetical protein [Streptomyces]|uniref:ACT domain-containing protein n=2 Tax=Streptomyces violaceusniger group TaxID=2839105 RepID=A0ABD5J7H5_9ACTN|nr:MULTISPECIES: hypothetical protein [Streptomyces]MEE4583229.1 hypothetical protein [Streptomyces sp. DSM 41602]KUL44906.1 hypothetical protein ADL28_39150 [Streptomyces violaceusniger]QTI87906.1 hypothetical protein AS97_44185 [Streptomyces sp. AgN23]RSS40469.1 hypothetical protein EF902_25005 [Streptomyces sp. WAC05858]WTA80162.1 hypothetical protein OG751_09410 [Streptomyces antimycoticus]
MDHYVVSADLVPGNRSTLPRIMATLHSRNADIHEVSFRRRPAGTSVFSAVVCADPERLDHLVAALGRLVHVTGVTARRTPQVLRRP